MTKRNEKCELEIKIEKFYKKSWKELRYDCIEMIEWLMFYKPKSKADKVLHIVEFFIVLVILDKVING